MKQDEMLLNLGGNQFSEIAPEAGVINAWGRGRSVAWDDYNHDGFLDLFVSRGTELPMKQSLYQNNGEGTLTDVTDQAGLGNISN